MQHRSRQNSSIRSASLTLKTMLLVAGFILLSGIAFSQTAQFEIDNRDAQSRSRLVSMIVPFDRGTVPNASSLVNYKLSIGGQQKDVFWQSFGAPYDNGSIRFARAYLYDTFAPGVTVANLVQAQNHRPVYQFGPQLAAGIQTFRIHVAFETDVVELITSPSLTSEYEGGRIVFRADEYVGDLHVKIWGTIGHLENHMSITLNFYNDKIVNPPGELEGNIYVGFTGGYAVPRFWIPYGIQLLSFSENSPGSYWMMPISNLADGQGWGTKYIVSMVSPGEAAIESCYPIRGIPTYDTWKNHPKAVEIPVPEVSASYRANLKSNAQNDYSNFLMNTQLDPWDGLGASKNTHIAGDQSHLGTYPYNTQPLMYAASADGLDLLTARQLREQTARTSHFEGLQYFDPSHPESVYLWEEYPHHTSINKMDRYDASANLNIDRGDSHGWRGKEYEWFGITPFFHYALITGDPWAIDEIHAEGIRVQCCMQPSYYFTSNIDIHRAEGRSIRELWQAWLLTNDTAFKQHAMDRLQRIVTEWKPMDYGCESIAERVALGPTPPYPPVREPWQEGLMVFPFVNAFLDWIDINAQIIVEDLTEDIVYEGWHYINPPGQYRCWKYYAVGNPSLGVGLHPTNDGINFWTYAALRSAEAMPGFLFVRWPNIVNVLNGIETNFPDHAERNYSSGSWAGKL